MTEAVVLSLEKLALRFEINVDFRHKTPIIAALEVHVVYGTVSLPRVRQLKRSISITSG